MLLGRHTARKPTRQSLRQTTFPQVAEAAMATSATANPSELDIVLFNVSGNPQKQMDIYTDLENCPIPLFVLGLDEISEQSQKALCSRLDIPFYRQDGLVSIHCRHLEKYEISFVDQDTLETVKEEADKEYCKYFTVARLKACVLKPADPDYRKVLLVAWSGHGDGEYPGHAEMSMYDKCTTLTKLVRFVDRLKETEGCDLVIVGGDFNMSREGTGNILKTIKPEGEVVSGTQDEHNRHAIIYWPRNKLEYGNTNTINISRFDLQPTTDQGTEHDFHPTLGIALITDQRKNNELARQKAMRCVLGKVKDDYTGSLFVLCQDGITGPKHKILCEKLRFDYRSCGQKEAGVYYRRSEQYEVTYVEETTLAKAARLLSPQDHFTVACLKARVFAPKESSYPRLLLVSWHGPEADEHPLHNEIEQRQTTFRKLGQFLDSLQKEKECEVVVVGGNFNLSADEILEKKECKVLQLPEERQSTDNTDYLIYWPENKLKVQAKGRTVGMLFSHNAFAYTFEVQPRSPAAAAINTSPGHPRLTILLLNLHIQFSERQYISGMDVEEELEEVWKDVLLQEEYSTESALVILRQAKRDHYEHSFFKSHGFDSRQRKEEAGVYCHQSSVPRYDEVVVTESTLEEQANHLGDSESFPLDRLMACVLTPTGDSSSQLLLVSWHGPSNSLKHETFCRFIHLLACLQLEENCQAVLAGGDFNLPSAQAQKLLKDMKWDMVALETYSAPIGSKKDPIDYIIYWPKDSFQKMYDPSVVCPDFTTTPGDPNRPFDHPIVVYRLRYPADTGQFSETE